MILSFKRSDIKSAIMGQYYYALILRNNTVCSVLQDQDSNAPGFSLTFKVGGNQNLIKHAINPHNYFNGAKLMEHSYIGTNLMNLLEYLISSNGIFYKSSIVWAGDYAEKEPNTDKNLYEIANEIEYPVIICPKTYNTYNYRYIVNHSRGEYVDKESVIQNNITEFNSKIHPLPLLVTEGNGRGSGDYDGPNQHLCGRWARDIISVELTMPTGFTELICDFKY